MKNVMIFLGCVLMGWPLGYALYLFIQTIFFNPEGVPYYGR